MTIYSLYVKQHTITGLKYLGYTKKLDVHQYRGSGKYWLAHLRKHGSTYTTEILKECSDKADITRWGLHYSNLWDIVNSTEWANLKPESGDGGQHSSVNAGRVFSEDHKAALRAAKHSMTEETKESLVQSGKKSYAKTLALLTREQRQEKYKNSLGKLTPEQRHENSKKTGKKGGKKWSDASANQVTVTDRTGVSKRVPRQLFLDMKAAMIAISAPQSEWEFVQVSSTESKRRRSNNGNT